jgi:DNA-binding NarL/FixJ family response regulator
MDRDIPGYKGRSGTLVRVWIIAPATENQSLRAMLAEVENWGIEVDGASVLGELDLETPLVGIDVVVVAGEESLEDVAHMLDDGAALILLSEDAEAVERVRELSLQGWGILPEDASSEELTAAILAAANGLAVVPAMMTDSPEVSGAVEEPDEHLTPREGEILNLLAAGMSNKMISHELHISEHTVKFHISSLYAKLDVGNRAGAVSQGARRGLISL